MAKNLGIGTEISFPNDDMVSVNGWIISSAKKAKRLSCGEFPTIFG
jgi:hypothetical protein